MHDIIIANLIFHSLATLALLLVSAATALHGPLRRRAPRTYRIGGDAPNMAPSASVETPLPLRESVLGLRQAEAA
jgi:hypothetical protein